MTLAKDAPVTKEKFGTEAICDVCQGIVVSNGVVWVHRIVNGRDQHRPKVTRIPGEETSDGTELVQS